MDSHVTTQDTGSPENTGSPKRLDTTASIPREYAIRISKILEREGYLSVSEFVRDAIRRRLEEIEKEVD